MTALHDIFTYALPASVFLFGAVVFLLLCAAAALWPWRRRSQQAKRAGGGAGRDYAPNGASIIRS